MKDLFLPAALAWGSMSLSLASIVLHVQWCPIAGIQSSQVIPLCRLAQTDEACAPQLHVTSKLAVTDRLMQPEPPLN